MLFCFSQKKYPKKVIIGNETLVIITPVQLGLTNGIIVERNFLRQELDLTKSILIDKDCLLDNQKLQLENYSSVVKNYQLQIENLNKISLEQQKIWEQQKKNNRKRNWYIASTSISIGMIIGILICR